MPYTDGGRGRRPMLEELINASIADVTINPDVSKELGKGGLRIQAQLETYQLSHRQD